MHAISVVSVTVLWLVVVVHLRGGTRGGQWHSSVCPWAKRTGAGAPVVDRSFLAWMAKQRIKCNEFFGDKVRAAPAPSVCRCICTVIIGEHEEEPGRERGAVWNLFQLVLS